MRFGIFYEHQLPRPWQPDGEHKLFKDALDQIELADRPEFAERTEVAEKAKAERLARAVEAALARREPAREAPDTVLVPTPGF